MKHPRSRAAALSLHAPWAALLLAGCAALPPPEDDPDFTWVPAGRLDKGCVFYVKRPRRPEVMVDQALWYQRADGGMTADADECAPRPTAP